jgi:tyrosyl-tRNA synthetase
MNELIEKLWSEFLKDCYNNLDENQIKLLFSNHITKACKAQRNACKRRFQEELTKRIHGANSLDTIQHAEITEQDYEVPNE